jgi:hypothetical protein
MSAELAATTIEFHRFGGAPGVLLKDAKYIRTCGYQKAAAEVTVAIEPKELRRSLNQLRYGFNATEAGQAAAQQRLGQQAGQFLDEAQFAPLLSSLHQVDVVTHASELRAFPFEAVYANNAEGYAGSADAGMVLTRRIRSPFTP